MGKGTHAEMQGWKAMQGKSPTTTYAFEQDQAPCEDCHPEFLKLSQNYSFIVQVKEAGYAIQAGVKLAKQLKVSDGTFGTPSFVVASKHFMLDKAALPATLYYHAGVAYLGARPNDFPVSPPF